MLAIFEGAAVFFGVLLHFTVRSDRNCVKLKCQPFQCGSQTNKIKIATTTMYCAHKAVFTVPILDSSIARICFDCC